MVYGPYVNVSSWHLADMQVCASNVRFQAESGRRYAGIDTNGFTRTRLRNDSIGIDQIADG